MQKKHGLKTRATTKHSHIFILYVQLLLLIFPSRFTLAQFSPTTTTAPATAPLAASPSTKPAFPPITAILQKVDDSTTGIGWAGVEDDQLLIVLRPQPGKEEPAKIPLMDVTELVLRKGSPYSAATASFTLSTPPATQTSPASPSDSGASTAPTTRQALVLNCRMILADGDTLLGALVGWSDKKLKIMPNIAPASALEIPIAQLRQFWCGSADQIKKAQALKDPLGLEDVAFVASDNEVIAVRGIAIDIQDEKLTFRYDNEERKISLNRLVGLMMAKVEDTPTDDTLHAAVQFTNGDQISGRMVALEPKELEIQTRAGASIRVPVDQVAKISIRNGRQVFLSDLKPGKVEQTPYFDRLFEYRIDKSLNGKPITLSDGVYPRGVSMHSRCVLTYNLEGRFTDFKSKVGFLLPEGKIGQATIRVIGDGTTLWEKLEARGDQVPENLNLKIEGVRELKLEVDYGNNDDVADRVAFANARLLRAGKQQ